VMQPGVKAVGRVPWPSPQRVTPLMVRSAPSHSPPGGIPFS